ncbi:RTA1 like protein-domain-containing protein [Hyaloscypha finlandica]|nr:RTA1 like protein-domain-containing protein [Hyaloscypha finlandica]KAH8784172.1 RTA1 like protein-domain-containing protein [Hyaloscypha sp. PMI_1271]
MDGLQQCTIPQQYNIPCIGSNGAVFNLTEVDSINITQFNGEIYPAGFWLASNITSIAECIVELCSLKYANVDYVPNAGSNFLFAVIFAFFLLTQLVFWVWRRTHSFSFAISCGLILEILGYLARVIMKHNMFSQTPFLIQIICLTLAPVFFTAGIYLTLSRVIMHYGPQHSRLTPKTYTITFICSDFIALVLQSAGGGIADQGSLSASTRNGGVHLMVAGLPFQVLSILIFMDLCAEFFRRVKKDRTPIGSGWATRDAASRHFKLFIYRRLFDLEGLYGSSGCGGRIVVARASSA